VACSEAAAQLPQLTGPVNLPVEDGAAGELLPAETVERVVDETVNKPLPEPVEQVVQESPVGPVRDELRGVVNQALGTGGGGSDGGGSGGGSGGSGSGSGGGTAGSEDGGSTGSGAGGTPGGSPGSNADRSGGGRGSRDGSRGRARGREDRSAERDARPVVVTGRSTVAAGDGRRQRRGDDADSGPGRSPAIRTIETIVRSVPTPIWIALGALSLVGLGLGARTLVERRRAGALARDREQLIKDVAALERALLPAVPERVGAVATSVAFRSSDGPAAGGDFYDAFELPDGRAVVLVGDVSGHGPDALEPTNSVRSQLHALLEGGMSPRAALAVVGERAPLQLAGRFTTVVVAVHDPATGTMTFATAGHAPPIIVGPAAEQLLSAGASPPIGIGVRTGLRETTVALPRGSLACFYTDGLVEAKRADAMIGRAGLEAMVESLGADGDALALLERVLAEADEAPDDMAVCLVRPVAGAEAPSARVEIVEIDADDIASGFAARFLAACGVPAGGIAVAIDDALAALGTRGQAVVEVTIADGRGRARVSDAGTAATPATAYQPVG
jgi:hypothetical protein